MSARRPRGPHKRVDELVCGDAFRHEGRVVQVAEMHPDEDRFRMLVVLTDETEIELPVYESLELVPW